MNSIASFRLSGDEMLNSCDNFVLTGDAAAAVVVAAVPGVAAVVSVVVVLVV
jgi:hypothetical protein